MQISDLQGLVFLALTNYCSGNQKEQKIFDPQQVASYQELEAFETEGVAVFAWIGAAEASDSLASLAGVIVQQKTVILYARGKALGKTCAVYETASMLIDDLTAMLCLVCPDVRFHSFEEPIINRGRADVLIRAELIINLQGATP